MIIDNEDAAMQAERIEKRKQLFKEFAEISWAKPEVTTESIVRTVREGRDDLSARNEVFLHE